MFIYMLYSWSLESLREIDTYFISGTVEEWRTWCEFESWEDLASGWGSMIFGVYPPWN